MNPSRQTKSIFSITQAKALWFILTCLVLLVVSRPVLAAQDTEPQKITLTVLDKMDRPVAGAMVSAEARAGKPASPGPWKTDSYGRVVITWLPQNIDLAKGTRSEDKLYELKSEVRLTVSAPGFGEKTLSLGGKAAGQIMANPKLASLSKKAVLRPLSEVVVLEKAAELLAGKLDRKSDDAKAREKCLAFIARNGQALKAMGISFASPAFELRGDMLRLRVKWEGQAWGGLLRIPFKARAVMNAGLPLAFALGKELLPLPGVRQADIWVESREKGGDELAAPRNVAVVLGATSQAFVSLGTGRTPPPRFVRDNPVVIRRTGS